MSDLLIREVVAVDGDGEVRGGEASDVLVVDGRIAAIAPAGSLARDAPAAAAVVEGDGRLLLPGFVDAHSHASGRVFDADVQLALLRQGVTSVIAGQDGVGWAPGDGAYATEYFAAIDGPHPGYAGGGVAELLAAHDGTTPLNVGYLVPAGTVRHLVTGRSTDAPSPDELAAMVRLVAEGLEAGALGLSTGLDYVPGIFASTTELTALARPVAEAGGVVASHLRGGYESGSAAGVAELAAIARDAGTRVHISHFHAEPAIVLELMAGLAAGDLAGGRPVDATFDAYPYGRGCSILAMPILPASLTVRPVDEVLAVLRDPAERARLLDEWFPTIVDYPSLGPDWPSMLTFAHVAAAEYDWAHGLTLAEAAARHGVAPADLALDVLVASRLEVNVVMSVRAERSDADLARILAHPAALGGSDGIFVGRHPHPRARGTFARYLDLLVRTDHGPGARLDWAGAAALCSTRAADRFALGDRGRVRVGAVADLVLVDPAAVRDRATYDRPLELAEGIDDVVVAGVPVLARGALTCRTPGRGLRRAARAARPEVG
ncbi:amidohydrolase family protein [Agromyces sp. G08B096]|uniref:Amidohydrolase family protein n=1 Tax=Agromyces sp. G08B096 TaxID=3156399 RepID=A0AAU7W638_9MICO